MTTAIVLAVVLALALIGQVVTLSLLIASRRRVRVLRARLERGRGPRSHRAANLALRAVVGTAARVREQGVSQFLTSSVEELTGIALADRSEIAKVAGPDGTVTILFSDIEDSTALNELLGDAEWVRLLAAHDKIVRKHVGKQRGHVVKSQGDGFMVVFRDPRAGTAAAVAIQDALAVAHTGVLGKHPIRVRMGLHHGPVVHREKDIFGRNVAMAARVASQAEGGEILVSDDVHEALGDHVVYVDSRVATLKGFEGEYRLWELAWPLEDLSDVPAG